jgi:hypothetical protein
MEHCLKQLNGSYRYRDIEYREPHTESEEVRLHKHTQPAPVVESEKNENCCFRQSKKANPE